MDIESITSVSVISPDASRSRKLYVDAIGLPLERLDDDYYASEAIDGCRHFGVWPLAQAAESCFGTSEWPSELTVPQVSVEFEVRDAVALDEAAAELAEQGYSLLHAVRTEPWGQMITRVQSPEGAIVGISYVPSLHEAAVG